MKRFLAFRLAAWGLITLCWLAGGSLGHAQEVDNITLPNRQIRISYWKKSHGLPTRHIKDLALGKRGSIWLATNLGLVCFDGKKFAIIKLNTPNVKPKDLNRILVDSKGYIWLFFRDGSELSTFRYDPFLDQTNPVSKQDGQPLHLSARALQCICAVNDTLWILDPNTGSGGYFDLDANWHDAFKGAGKANGGHFVFPAGQGKFWWVDFPNYHLNLLNESGEVLNEFPIQKGSKSSLWVGHSGTLYFIGPEDNHSSNTVGLLKCDEQEGLIPVGQDESYRIDWGNGMTFDYNSLPIRSNNKAGIELNYKTSGIDVYDCGKLIYSGLDRYFKEKHRLSAEHKIFVVEDGSFWMIVSGALVRLEVLPNYFTNYLHNHLKEPVSTRGIWVLHDTMYVSSYQGHLEVNLRDHSIREMTALNQKRYGMGVEFINGKLWKGHHGNVVSVYTPATGQVIYYPLEGSEWNFQTNGFFQTPRGDIYLGTAFGLFRFDPQSKLFYLTSLRDKHIICFLPDQNGLWVGTSNGLLWMNPNQDPMENSAITVFPFLIPSEIRGIHKDKEGYLWMATSDGLWKWFPWSSVVEVYNEQNTHLPSNHLHAVYEDHKGRLWLPSNDGLVCFDKKSEKIHTFGIGDGLTSSEFNMLSHFRDQDGRLYLGGIDGINSFHPDSVPIQFPKTNKIALTSIKLTLEASNQVINLTKNAYFNQFPLVVPASTRQISIVFSTPNYNGETSTYKWRIPEKDSAWTSLNDSRIDIFYPPNGTYTIEIMAYIEGDNLTPPTFLRLPLFVEEPFLGSTNSLVLFAVVLSFIIVLLFEWRQNRLRHLSAKLQREVTTKTVELQMERDVIAWQAKELRNMDEAKSQFFQDISHEIRTPLTLILGPVSELLKMKDLSVVCRENLERIKRNTHKIMSLIEEVLELTRLDAGVVPLNLKPLELEVLTSRVFHDFEAIAAQRGINFQLAHQVPIGLMVQTDAGKLEKIVTNLIQNALKYTTRGGSVMVNAAWFPDCVFRLEVRDTGPGIAPEHLNRVFDRFYQAPGPNVSVSKKGFGIGLAMCQSYTKLLGGQLQVESTPGWGTTMRLTLPFKDQTGKFCQPDNVPAMKPLEQSNLEARILIVDDEQEILEYVANLLSDHYEVIRADSAGMAWEQLRTAPLALVISDLVMPHIDGLELLSWMRKGGPNQTTPFVLLTGFHTKETMKKATSLGCTAYLSKPINEQELLDVVRQLVQGWTKQLVLGDRA